jgi:hypothetical protein
VYSANPMGLAKRPSNSKTAAPCANLAEESRSFKPPDRKLPGYNITLELPCNLDVLPAGDGKTEKC